MPVLFILMLCAYLAGNYYVLIRGLQALHAFPGAVKWIFGAIYVVCALLIVFVFALRNTKMAGSWLSHFIFEVGTSWLVITLYMTLLLLVFDCFRLFNHPAPYSYLISIVVTVCILS
ncbi:MAG: metallophosphoesterase, partial [Tannerella sp.]|nr:metallophosphoesterase [Tannerella sp.]